jgi:hypothetical protein
MFAGKYQEKGVLMAKYLSKNSLYMENLTHALNYEIHEQAGMYVYPAGYSA